MGNTGFIENHSNILLNIRISAEKLTRHKDASEENLFFLLVEQFAFTTKAINRDYQLGDRLRLLGALTCSLATKISGVPDSILIPKLIELTKAKNSDYTNDSHDPFKNFRYVEKLKICTVKQGMLARMSDKVQRLGTWVNKRELRVNDESVLDTAMDLVNYSALLIGYLQEGK